MNKRSKEVALVILKAILSEEEKEIQGWVFDEIIKQITIAHAKASELEYELVLDELVNGNYIEHSKDDFYRYTPAGRMLYKDIK
jgi:hypothetical protein